MSKVSVIIPTFNTASYLREAIDSALRQTYRDMEVIVVDDGSTDETSDMLATYGDRIRALRQENQGQAVARNWGAEVARGEWLAFLDADDVWLPEKIELQLDRRGEFAVSCTDAIRFGDGMKKQLASAVAPGYQGRVFDQLLLGNFIICSSVVIRREVFQRYRGFDPRHRIAQDWDLWLKVCADRELGYLELPLVRYRVHSASVTMRARRSLRAHIQILDDTFGAGGVAENRQSLRRRAYANAYRVVAICAALAGDGLFSAHCAARSLCYAPFVARSWKMLVKGALLPFGLKY